MQQLPNAPHGSWVELWHGFALSTVLAIVAALRLWLNRKKPSADVHETEARSGRTRAEAIKADAEASKAFSELAVAMSQQVRELNQQLRHREDLEELARARCHVALTENQRAVFKVREYEEILRGLPNAVIFEPFKMKTNKEIMDEADALHAQRKQG